MSAPQLRNWAVAGALISLCGVGCSSLGKPQIPPPGQFGKPQGFTAKAEAMVQGTLAKVKRVLPGDVRNVEMDVVDEHDPTRLANMPKDLSPELFVSAARLSEQGGRYEQAFEQYQKALSVNPKDRSALIGMGRFQFRAEKWDQAIAVYNRALQAHPGDPVIMNDLGLVHARAGNLQQAIGVLSAAHRAAPSRELYLNNLAACLVEAGRHAEAVDQLARMHGPAKANYNVGYLLHQSGKRQLAEGYLQAALTADPNLSQARALLGTQTR